ncbi:Ribonuclease CAF1 [Artemisia annua]|uniref:poly(A)-specific ribonuclease n=1 Tax=Artemisia annua TaxID=35608 RepID=A0A2U1MVJ6_ARTAN|nr:Ribonuclease CAF1 [Artemisia annua]
MSSCIDKTITIREVWSHNLEHEFSIIRSLIDEYSYISMDTEFPGVIFKPSTTTYKHPKHHGQPLEHYKLLKSNVDFLNLIQLGLTLTDENGNLPCMDGSNGQRVIWEFNFKEFDVARDAHAPESIDLLRRQGIDFEKNKALPCELSGFLEGLRVFFGANVYDVKHLMKFCKYGLYGGLDRVASLLDVNRVAGKCHQAGSDSLLTWHTFQKMRDVYFVDVKPEKSNVDILNIIQLNLALTDANGNFPCIDGTHYSLRGSERDPHTPESIESLKSQGFDFENNRVDGIRSIRFGGVLLMGSGLVLNKSEFSEKSTLFLGANLHYVEQNGVLPGCESKELNWGCVKCDQLK